MASQKLLCRCLFLLFSLLLSLSGERVVEASSHYHHHHHHYHHHHHHHHHRRYHRRGQDTHSSSHSYPFRPSKLFVFGDSYADTGNIRKSQANSWKLPYGITFPGKPAGRFSDGRVLTDFFAKYLGVKSPLPYQWRKLGPDYSKHGMNFAFGGTGVFDTLVGAPNMTSQINFLEEMIRSSTYSTPDLQSALALLTLSGNDYSVYLGTGGSALGLPAFITRVVSQVGVNLERIHGLGMKKVMVAALQPLGCLPSFTAASAFQTCNDTINSLVSFHNQLLHQAVAQLNNHTGGTNFIVADLYSSFMTVFNNAKGNDSKFRNPLKPCCMGISSEYYCGSVDVNNGTTTKYYTVCDDPESAFFWDMVHPTQEGWRAVSSSLSATLHQL